MKIDLKRNPNGVNECFYEALECLLSEYDNLYNTCDHIVDMASPYQMRRYVKVLLENIIDLQHYKSTTLGLYATDKVEMIVDESNIMFELKDGKYISHPDLL